MRKLVPEEIKSYELEILKEYAAFCKKWNLHFTLWGGTLIGALRHNGFIPWDDDIDITMPRKDYDLLVSLTEKEKIGENIALLCPGDKNYYYPFIKIYNSKTIAKMEDNMTEHGIWIDIFPLDNVPKSLIAQIIKYRISRLMRAITIAMTTDYKSIRKTKKYIIKRVLAIIGKMMGSTNVLHIMEKNAKSTKRGTLIGNVVWPYGRCEILDAKMYYNPKKVSFEGSEYLAPGCYDAYLKATYGEYMKFPPQNKRKTHGVDAWEKE